MRSKVLPSQGGLDLGRKDGVQTSENGSVGIGGAQTGVYPSASPGGWQLIGRTALPLFDAEAQPPTLLQPGDRLRFVVERCDV